MAKKNVIIVGNGLFGSVAATLARAEGHNVTVVSEKRPYEASPASGCVLAPSWLSSLDKAEIATSMDVLGALYTVHDMEFRTNVLKSFKAKRVATAEVLVKPDIVGRVTRVGDGKVWFNDSRGEHNVSLPLQGIVLVCAGIWCQELLKDMPAIRGLYGASLRISAQLEAPRLAVYAPYRQAVAFNMDKKTVWFGDGTALIERTWLKEEEERKKLSLGRAHKLFKLPGSVLGVRAVTGARPYVEGHKSGYFERVMPRTYVSTGGAKNGTILAAWQAHRFVKEAL